MKHAKISELENNLIRWLAYVRRGGTVRVFDRAGPVADLVPCRASDDAPAVQGVLEELERKGMVRRGHGPGLEQRGLPHRAAARGQHPWNLRARRDLRRTGLQ